ncbi:MAG: hypothetical protein ICV83_15090 [Cytophagales bacterium]|nr:hypothetical protein [Cytophagales bacterium]
METLEVVIGIIFVYTLTSIICSTIREGIEAWLKTRAAYLEYGIRELLHDRDAAGLAKSFYEHPLIHSLFSENYVPGTASGRPGMFANGSNLPSYIPARNFAQALMDLAARGPKTDVISSDPNAPVISLENIRTNILNLKNPPVQRVLLTAIDTAQGDLNRAQANLEAWYDSGMDRVSGWYKRSTSWVLFWIGLFTAVALNINTITIADYLYRNDAARAALVARAEAAAKDTSFTNRNYEQARAELNAMALPIGWGNVELGLARGWWESVFAPLLGWLLTAFAATLGAPFWFDLLNKVMVIRSTVKPHEKSPEEDSEDRQFPRRGGDNAAAAGQGNGGQGNGGQLRNPSLVAGPRQFVDVPSPADEESDIDGCSAHNHNTISATDLTPDEELPAATGGVA